MKKLYLILLFVVVAISGMAQTIGDAFYIYRNDGQFNAFFRDEVDSIAYSNYDADSVYYDEIVTQLVYTQDSIYWIPLASVDSVGFVQPEVEYKPDIMRMNKDWLSYVISTTESTISFMATTPAQLLPTVGQTIVAETFEPPFEKGFAGKVIDRQEFADSIVFHTDAVLLSDIYNRLVTVGFSSSVVDNVPTSRVRKVFWQNTDRGIHFPLPNVDLSIGPITLSARPELVLKYIICVMEDNLKNYVDIKFYHNFQGSVKIDCKIDGDYKPEPKWVTRIPIPTEVPGLYGQFMIGGFVRASGAVQLSASQSFTANGVAGFVYSENNGLHGVNSWNASMPDPEIELSLDGSVSAGLAVRLQFGVIHERLASADITAYIGPKFSGNLGLTSAGLVDHSLYSAIKDSEITLSLDAEVVPGYRWAVQRWIGGINRAEEHQELPVSLNLGGPLNHWYVVPEFRNLAWHSDETGSSGTLSGDINRNLLPKVGLGWGLYDEKDEVFIKNYFQQTYRKLEDWPQKGLEYHVKDLPYGAKYKAYPLVNLFGTEMRAGNGVELGTAPLVNTIGSNDVKREDAVLSGHVEGLGYGMVVDAGICYTMNKDDNKWVYVSAKTKNDGDYSVSAENLTPNTTYYYCAYAYIDGEYYYSDEVLTFTTKEKLSVSTLPANSSGTTANVRGRVGNNILGFDDGEVGFFYNTTGNPSNSNAQRVIAGNLSYVSNCEFQSTITGLNDGTTYYYCAYLLQNGEYKYGEVLSFTTMKAPDPDPVAITGASYNVKTTTATISCTYENVPGGAECGYYLQSQGSGRTFYSVGNMEGSKTINLSNLKPSTTYYYTAAIKNNNREYTGAERSFTTEKEKEPKATTGDYYDLSNNSVVITFSFENVPIGAKCQIQLYDEDMNETIYDNLSPGKDQSLVIKNLRPYWQYSYIARIIDQDNWGYAGIRKVFKTPMCPDENHPHWVDLGLPSGTKWSCCNEGASKPEDCGGYYTFGQISSAPSIEQINELFDCYIVARFTSEKPYEIDKKINGVSFYGPNNGGIFFPIRYYTKEELISLYEYDYSFMNAGFYGYYWSNTSWDKKSGVIMDIDNATFIGFGGGEKLRSKLIFVRSVQH